MKAPPTVPFARALYWATIGHAFNWLSYDGRLSTLVNESRGKLDQSLVRKIAIAYGVSRGIPRKRTQAAYAADAGAAGLAKLINQHGGTWSNGLSDRCNQCIQIAKIAKRTDFTQKLQVSAISKLSWFVRPDDWTVFDQYAANGLGIPKYLDAEKRMARFYNRLQQVGFLELAAEVHAVINTSDLPFLHGTRLLDELLMGKMTPLALLSSASSRYRADLGECKP